MLLLIGNGAPDNLKFRIVSIHLMLLLICCGGCQSPRCCCGFNTSHVTINPFRWVLELFYINVSIHLMLLLILMKHIYPLLCGIVSIHLMLLLIAEYTTVKDAESCFNTSHVTINPSLRIFLSA